MVEIIFAVIFSRTSSRTTLDRWQTRALRVKYNAHWPYKKNKIKSTVTNTHRVSGCWERENVASRNWTWNVFALPSSPVAVVVSRVCFRPTERNRTIIGGFESSVLMGQVFLESKIRYLRIQSSRFETADRRKIPQNQRQRYFWEVWQRFVRNSLSLQTLENSSTIKATSS